MIDVRDNWRILLLVALSVVAATFLFAPQLGGSDEPLNGTDATIATPTNLQYGLELSGGTRVRGQLVGATVEGAAVPEGENQATADALAEALGVEPIDVLAQPVGPETATIEVFANRTDEEIASALESVGVEYDRIRNGVTDQTRDGAVQVLQDRINRAPGISGGSVSSATPFGGGQPFIIVEAPGIDGQQLRDLIGDPGRVQIVATFPEGVGENQTYRRESVIESQDIADVDPARSADDRGGPRVPVSLSASAAERFVADMQEYGFTQPEALRNCNAEVNPDAPGYCLQTVVDGEVVHNASMGGLQDALQGPDPTFLVGVNARQFTIGTGTFSEATDLAVNLQSGELPAEYNIQTESFISPSTAQQFRPLALLTGLAAWLVVSGVVYFWYRDPRVAVPMLATASAEVFLLLGFAAAVGLPLDLSHIAGFIAVIGTGLDDLIIMADEILQRKKDVTTGRIYQRRFRRAFWIIGMAAATTIIAMSPLAVLSLGDLRGFAIITIVGVLIGVGITRPAYGDILRKLMLDDVRRS